MIECRRMWMKVDGNICGATCISDATILTYGAPPAMAGPCVGASKVGRWTRVVHLIWGTLLLLLPSGTQVLDRSWAVKLTLYHYIYSAIYTV